MARRALTRSKRGVTALGFRVKSGWALAVLIAGPVSAPRVLDRRRVELSDPEIPATRQPYHEGFGREQSDARAVRRLVAIVTRCARESVARLLRGYRAAGFTPLPRKAGLVVGSLIDPAAIANQHIRAHASEGRLFRVALEDGARRAGLATVVMVERTVYETAARALRRSPRQVRSVVAELGRSVEGAWRAEEKTAAAAAWLALVRRAMPSTGA